VAVEDSGSFGLLDHEGRRAAGVEISGLIRASRTTEAEAWLAERLRGHPGLVASACLGVSADDVVVEGWDEMNADLMTAVRRGHLVTAVGLDLSNYNDSGSDVWWDKPPAVEVSAYTDSSYPFSTATVEEMLAASTEYAAPWTGGMLGEEMQYLEVPGLRPVNAALLRHQEDRGDRVETSEDVAAYLGWWWQHLRFRQAVAHHFDEHGLAVAAPVVVGSHDCGPWLVTVHHPGLLTETGAIEDLVARRARDNLERYENATRETVEELMSLRENSRASWGLKNRDKRKTYVAYADARLALICEIVGLPKQRGSIARMHDDYFAGLVAAYVDWRRTRAQQFPG
jgi:hypothetical protein